jgi:galactokinase/mevalonate kinase-like predicted kinase
MYTFDYCIITASSEKQARDFNKLIDSRRKHGLYPREVQFKVMSDPPTGRIGNGGNTVLSLKRLCSENKAGDPLPFFQNKKILIIHAGGESRRLPCFAPEGKLFAPVPVETSSIYPPVLLDLQLNLFFKYPWKKGEVLLASGDVLIDFNVSLLPEDRGAICGFAKPASLDFSSRHGVFVLNGDQRTVVDFLQKAPPNVLTGCALIEGTKECAIDMGLISLSPEVACAFLEFSEQSYKDESNIGKALEKSMLSFNLYLELLTACVKNISFTEYHRRVSIGTTLDRQSLKKFYDTFHVFPLQGVLTSSTTFIHLGSLHEFPSACEEIITGDLKPFYSQQNEEIKIDTPQSVIAYNCEDITFPPDNHEKSVLEDMKNCDVEKASGNNILIGLRDWAGDFEIPKGMCIDSRFINGSRINLVYSVHDTFLKVKNTGEVFFCSKPMDAWLRERKLKEEDIWSEDDKYDLVAADLFCSGVPDEFLEGYWRTPEDAHWSEQFKRSKRHSIKYVNENDDIIKRENRRIAIRQEYLRRLYRDNIGWKNISISDFKDTFADKKLHESLRIFFKKTDDAILRAYRKTLLSSIIEVQDVAGREPNFGIEYYENIVEPGSIRIGVKKDQIVWARSPVRLDLSGGWSDTPPHTLRLGGQVVNFAANLNGQPPIQVFCRRTKECHIRIHSIDIGITETIRNFKSLEDYKNPLSPFALPKAALCLIGITRDRFAPRTLENVLTDLGCGLEMTLLCAVPKGSGLGTSSILGGTILAALQKFFNLALTMEDLYWQVLKLEQMLTTGGGWQDQIGGIVGGIKYIESKPGYKPNFLVHQLDPYLLTDWKTLGCFTLFYTGFTRLAKNILQDVVSQANANTPAYIFTIKYLKQLAVDAKNAILMRDLPLLADAVSQSWEENKRIHFSTTNEEIENLLSETREFYVGAKLLGAGGGGYALFISENERHAIKLRNIISEKFVNDKARIVQMTLNTEGLQVSVS